MLPHIRHIHRFVVEEQEEHAESVGVEGFAKGMERVDLVEAEEIGWDESRVCEYRQTGHLNGVNVLNSG